MLFPRGTSKSEQAGTAGLRVGAEGAAGSGAKQAGGRPLHLLDITSPPLACREALLARSSAWPLLTVPGNLGCCPLPGERLEGIGGAVGWGWALICPPFLIRGEGGGEGEDTSHRLGP